MPDPARPTASSGAVLNRSRSGRGQRLGSLALLQIILVASGCLLSSCTGKIPQTRYYLLSEPQLSGVAASSGSGPVAGTDGASAAGREAVPDDRVALRLLAVQVPDYLQTRGLVVALADNRIQPATYHQWAEPLVAGLERYLGAALEAALTDVAGQGAPALLTVTLNHLHGSEAGTVVLDAEWRLLAREDRKLLARGRFEQTLEQVEPGYPALVAAHRRLLNALATAIVARWGSTSA